MLPSFPLMVSRFFGDEKMRFYARFMNNLSQTNLSDEEDPDDCGPVLAD
jgi:hypothetical protein